MNNTFNIKRFGLVMSKDFQESWKRYTMQFLAMFGIIAIFLYFQSDSLYRANIHGGSMEVDYNLLTFIVFIFLGFGVVFASTLTEPMRSKIKRGAYLMNPSSNLEKYVSRWLIVTVGYIIAFFVALWLADLLRVAICSVRYTEIDVNLLDFGKLIETKGDRGSYVFGSGNEFGFFVGLFFLLQSICVLGSTFWEKVSFVKTFATGTILVLLFLLLANWTISIFYTDFEQFINVLDSFAKENQMSDTAFFTITTSVFSLLTLVFWIFAFFRFRESEIIKRW